MRIEIVEEINAILRIKEELEKDTIISLI